MHTLTKIALFLFLFLSGLGALAFYWTFYRPLPDYETTLEFDELQQEVDIHWDSYGIPHIYADHSDDMAFAIGYVHAQDRLWQMTLAQLLAEGRMAEFFGEELVDIDIFQRTIGFWRIAGELEQGLSASTRTYLQAYAEGVNAFIENNRKNLPVEFALADIEPQSWTVRHTLALSRLMAWELNTAWKSELTLALLQQRLDPTLIDDLLPNREGWELEMPPPDTSTTGLYDFMQTDERFRELMGSHGFSIGSNAWAVDSTKSENGAPLLAGDPHLGLDMPGKWYEIHTSLNGRNLSGITLAGSPFVIMGQNDRLAWTATIVMADEADFFIEAVDSTDNNRYLIDSLESEPVYEQFERERELIEVRGQADTVITRYSTNHGPVISEIHPEKNHFPDRPVTMRWTGHDMSSEPDALYGMNRADNMEEFREAIAGFKVPGLNIIYADRAGNIAHFPAAGIPIRNGNPVAFREGWNPEQSWQGYVPYERLPAEINPDRGWVANANNAISAEEDDYYISSYWHDDSRYNRIRDYLSQNETFSQEAFRVMQNDSYSDYARRITNLILPVLEQEPQEFETAISYLENWDFRYEPSETAASIMEVFLLRLLENTLADELGEEHFEGYLQFSGLSFRTLHELIGEGSPLFDDIGTEAEEGRIDIIRRSMRQALDRLTQQYGDEPFEWRWENLHTVSLRPPLFGEAAADENAGTALQVIVNNLLSKGPYPAPGHSMSINNGEYRLNDPFDMVVGPSVRRIADLSDMSKTLSILPTGQSGNPLSEHFGDQTDSWLEGGYKFLYQDSTMFEEAVFQQMRLRPASN